MIAFILSLINYHYILKLSGAVYIGCIAILLAVIIAGQLGGFGGGSKRWITLPVIGRFQPSEFVKIGLILFFSWYLQKNQEKINQLVTLVTVALLAAIPLALILEQPDLSTTIVITFVILCLIFIAGISYKWIFGTLIVTVPLAVIFIYLAQLGAVPFLKGYQVNRILAFINPGKYAELNLQQDNSKMAIGSGMLYGKGLFNDTAISVKNGNFLSEEHTDFIFSVIGEELGFMGSMIVIALFVLVVFECLLMAQQAEDMAGRLLCTGMAALIGFQAFTNIAVATGIFPNTGLPLPFISYGVSSLVSLYIGIGIILNVGLQQRKHE
jgi:rod shape determining protein RodA